MIDVRPFDSLGKADHGWLKASHHFSFGSHYDPARMGWGALRVWNDDAIAPRSGFPPHPHADMEIITYVRDGAISHEDSLGNKGRTVAGDVQVMSAGSGIRHSEFNLENEPTRIFQIWILPDEKGGEPYWNAREFPKDNRDGQFAILASGRKGDDALPIRSDARVLGATLQPGAKAVYELEPGRHAYLATAKGRVRVNGVDVNPRDGAAIKDVARIEVEALDEAEIVLVDSR